MTISRVDASPAATFKAAYYLQGTTITRYFEQEASAQRWLEEELQLREREGLIWRVKGDTESCYRIRNLLGWEGLILGVAISCSDPNRNPYMEVALSEPGRYNVSRCFSFGGKRTFGAAYASACLAFARHNSLQLPHLRLMLGKAKDYLSFYQIEHYQDDADIASEAALALGIYAEELGDPSPDSETQLPAA